MRLHGALGVVVLVAPILAGCGASERAPAPYFVIPPGPAAQSNAEPIAEPAFLQPMLPTPNPAVQTFLPGHPEDVMRGHASVPQPSANATPFYAPPPNLGPVTGYGPGGMAQPPGAPPNPPYPAGGLTGAR